MQVYYILDLINQELLHDTAFINRSLAVGYLNNLNVVEGKFGYFYDTAGQKVAAIKVMRVMVEG